MAIIGDGAVGLCAVLASRRLGAERIALIGGVAPARAYIPELLMDVLAGTLDPSPIFDLTIDLEDTPEGYPAMDEHRAIKVLITTGAA